MEKTKRYEIVGGDDDTWGPRFGPIIAEDAGEIELVGFNGYRLLLLHLLKPFQQNEEKVEFLVVSPRYADFTLNDIRKKGCFVAICRILPEKKIDIQKGLSKSDIDSLAIGVCKPISA